MNSSQPGIKRLISYWPEAETYGIQVKVGPFDWEVATGNWDTRTVWVVPAIFVFACWGVHVPVNVELEGTGAKHDLPFWPSTAAAKAPDESNWRICNPGPSPRHCDNFNWKPVIARDCWNKKS